MDFETWMRKVDGVVVGKIGLSYGDMPDLVFVRDLYEDGYSPEQCADVLFDEWVLDGCVPAELIQ